jgi:uncharacterized protein YdhG (YjbR/CyaY superfamily)
MQRFVSTPEEYLEAIPEPQLPLLQHLRSLILQTAPEAIEEIRYGMLAYELGGGLYGYGLAAQKHFVALYVGPQALADMADELKGIDHGKGCLRFKRLESVPTEVISRLLTHAISARA